MTARAPWLAASRYPHGLGLSRLPAVPDASEFGALAYAITTATEAGRMVPCLGRPEWTSDNPKDRAAAATACRGCPVLAECEAAAEASHRPPFGVWAGRDRSHEADPRPAEPTGPTDSTDPTERRSP